MAWLISGALSRQDKATIAEKTTALNAMLTELSQLHDANFTVVSTMDDTLLDKAGNTRAHRLETMGDPERYILAMTSSDNLYGAAWDGRPGIRYDVFVYYGQGTSSAATAEAGFNALLDAVDDTTPGILYAVEAQEYFTSATNHDLRFTIEAIPVRERQTVGKKGDDDYWYLAHIILNIA